MHAKHKFRRTCVEAPPPIVGTERPAPQTSTIQLQAAEIEKLNAYIELLEDKDSLLKVAEAEVLNLRKKHKKLQECMGRVVAAVAAMSEPVKVSRLNRPAKKGTL